MTNESKTLCQYSYDCIGSDTVIIFIHGILGSPGQFDFLISETQNMELSILNLLLPGHGKTGKDFADSNINIWSEYVDNQINNMRKRYSHIILVGHSMGGLLAIQSYLAKQDNIEGIFCLALPLYFKMLPGGLINCIKVALNRVKESDEIAFFIIIKMS